MSYTYYDYLELSPGATPARIESAFLGQLERFGYGTSDTGQDMSGLVAMVHVRTGSCRIPRRAIATTRRWRAKPRWPTPSSRPRSTSTTPAHGIAGRLRRIRLRTRSRRSQPDARDEFTTLRLSELYCIQRCGRRPFFSSTGAAAARAAQDSPRASTARRMAAAVRARPTLRQPPRTQAGDRRDAIGADRHAGATGVVARAAAAGDAARRHPLPQALTPGTRTIFMLAAPARFARAAPYSGEA